MEKDIIVGSNAKDFELTDVLGNQVKLSQIPGTEECCPGI